MNTYKAFYKGKQLEINAETSYMAQLVAAKAFKAKKTYDVSVILMSLGEKEIVHKPTF